MQPGHALEPAAEYFPATQLVQTDDALAPVDVAYAPAEQLEQDDKPVTEA